MLVISDFLQLPSSGRMIFEHLTPTDVWHLFKLHELAEIVHQNSDPEFCRITEQIVGIGEQTLSDVAAIYAMADTDITVLYAMADTDISHWPENHFRSYMTNHLVGKQNMEVMNNATNTIFTVHAVDGRADGHTGAFQYNLRDDTDIAET